MPREILSAGIAPALADLEKKLAEVSADSMLSSEPVASSLLAHVKRCFTEAEQAKNTNGIIEGLSITDMLLEAQDRRNGIHTAKMKAKLLAQGLPNFYEPLTDQKCRDALAWWHDATVSYGNEWFRGEATEEAELPEDTKLSINQEVLDWEAQLRMSGAEPFTLEQLQKVRDEAYEIRLKAVKEFAGERAERMSTRIRDQFQDFGFQKRRDAFRLNLVTAGTAFYWGPFVKSVKTPVWKNGKRSVEDVQKPWAEEVSPLDIFPAPWMTETTDHGYIIRRMKVHPGELAGFKGVAGWQDKEIDAAISETTSGTPNLLQGDSQRATQEGKDQVADKRNDFMWFVGFVKGDLLKQYGAEFADKSKEYHVHVCWMGNHLLRVKANWWDLERPPCYKAVYDEFPGSFWGIGIPMKMRAAQDECNAVIIPMLDNIGWAAVGITEIDVFRLQYPEDATNWTIRRVIQVKDSDIPTTLSAVRHTQIPLLVQRLLPLLAEISEKADEQSGVRKYSMGSDKVAGAGRTRGGLAMLMDASSKTLKAAMYRADKAESELVEAFADWNNEFGPDDIKGDIKIVTNGASGFFIQEFQMQQINSMIDRLLNPTLLQVPGMMEQAVSLIRELGTSMRVNVRYIPSDKDISAKIEELRQQAILKAQGEAGGTGGQNFSGSPASPENESQAA
jgi:hypothetical protein